MSRTIEAVYENKVLKPLIPLKGLREHEKVMIIVCLPPDKKKLRKLAGSLTKQEADAMQKLINHEFERIEGEW